LATSSPASALSGGGSESADPTRVWVAVAGTERAQFIHSALTQAGMRPLDLDNSAEVLAWRDRPRRGAAVVDFSLPGAELLCQVLTAGSVYSPGVPVLAVLPDDADSTLESAFDAGAADFMLHPITPARLTHRLRFLLRAEDQRSALAESQRHLATVKRIARITYWEVDAADQLVWGNHAARVLGLDGDDIPRSLDALVSLAHAEDRPGLEDALKSGEPFALDWRCADASGRWLTLHQHAEVVERRGDLALLGGTLQDVTELRRAETTIARMKTRDALTGLGNRQHMIGEITHLLGDARRSGRKLAVIRLDISDFKRINHSYGMSAGDEVLRRLAARLSELVRRGPLHVDALASLGGDEFIAVVADLETPEALEAHLRCLRANCMVPIPLELLTGASEVVLRVRMGVAFFPEDGEDPETLLSNAGIAVAEAKRRNPAGDAFFFSAELNSRARERVALESDLRLAVELGELQLAFQPKVSARTGQVVGAEALVRWHHMEHGDVSPGRFIGLAEESGIITELGAWVLERSCRAAFDWQRRWQRSLTVAVNVSVEQLRHCDFPSVVERVLAQTGLAPELLELEITEGIMLVGEDSLELMRRLAALGVKLSIDDFGTGYSSLAYLKRLPIDTVKIDQSFVRSMLTVYDDKAIVEAIISLGHSLELNIVAEGVETAEQADVLAGLGCDVFQGYHFGRPMSPARWVRWLDGQFSSETTVEVLPGRPAAGM
jgi:diguanylate cyclase